MSNVISNCCSANPTCQDDIERDQCPKCFEHCDWIPDDDDKGDYLYECKKDNDKLNDR